MSAEEAAAARSQHPEKSVKYTLCKCVHVCGPKRTRAQHKNTPSACARLFHPFARKASHCCGAAAAAAVPCAPTHKHTQKEGQTPRDAWRLRRLYDVATTPYERAKKIVPHTHACRSTPRMGIGIRFFQPYPRARGKPTHNTLRTQIYRHRAHDITINSTYEHAHRAQTHTHTNTQKAHYTGHVRARDRRDANTYHA